MIDILRMQADGSILKSEVKIIITSDLKMLTLWTDHKPINNLFIFSSVLNHFNK